MYWTDYRKGMEKSKVCEKSKNVWEALGMLVMIAQGGEGGVTDAVLKTCTRVASEKTYLC